MKDKLINSFNKIKQDKNFFEVFSGSIISFSAKIIALLLGLLLSLIISKYYGARELGIYSLIVSFFSITLILSMLGMNTSILRFIPEEIAKYSLKSAYKLFFKLFNITIISSLFISLIVYLFADSIAVQIFNKSYLYPVFLIASIFIVFQSLGILSISTIRALKDIKLYSLFQIIMPLIQILTLFIIISFFSYSEFDSVYSLMFSYFIVFFISLYYVLKLFNKKEPDGKLSNLSTKSVIFTSLPMMLSTAMSLIILQTDILMLGAMVEAEQVGIYAIIVKLATLTIFLLTSVNVVIAPKISELFYSGKIIELKKLLLKTTSLISIFTLPIVLILIFFGKEILEIFGKEFTIGYSALIILLIGQIINILAGPVEFFLNMTGHQKNLNYIVITSAIINIILNFILIPKYGFMGAAFASMVSLSLSKIISLIYINKIFGFYIGINPIFFLKGKINND